MEKKELGFVTIEGKKVAIEGERNLLELIRKAGFNMVTFCYQPELEIYGLAVCAWPKWKAWAS